jgi:hypothetical protein
MGYFLGNISNRHCNIKIDDFENMKLSIHHVWNSTTTRSPLVCLASNEEKKLQS